MLIKGFKNETIPAFTFLYGEKETSYANVAVHGGKIMDGLMALLHKKKIQPVGPAIWTYKDLGKGKVLLKAGFPVEAGLKDYGKFKLGKEKERNCVSTKFNGSMEKIKEAWEQFGIVAQKKGVKPTKSIREVYTKWVAFDSPENVTVLQILVK